MNLNTKYHEHQTSVVEKLGLKNDVEPGSPEEIKIFPNPNTGSFEIQSNFPLQKEDVQIFDIFGNKLDFGFNDKSIRLSGPFNGIVFLQIQFQNKCIVKKLVVNEK